MRVLPGLAKLQHGTRTQLVDIFERFTCGRLGGYHIVTVLSKPREQGRAATYVRATRILRSGWKFGFPRDIPPRHKTQRFQTSAVPWVSGIGTMLCSADGRSPAPTDSLGGAKGAAILDMFALSGGTLMCVCASTTEGSRILQGSHGNCWPIVKQAVGVGGMCVAASRGHMRRRGVQPPTQGGSSTGSFRP